jgi:O-antigen ligase
LTLVIAAGALLIPLVISIPAEDSFRFPKELALRAEVILVVMVLAMAWGFRGIGLPRLDFRAHWLHLTALICAWTAVCATVSTNRLVSIQATLRVFEWAFLFVITVLVLRGRQSWFAGLIVLPAVINGIIYIFQEFDIWHPINTVSTFGEHLRRTALIGNPNDVGDYFVVPALVGFALALSSRRFRLAWGAAAALIVVATFVTHTVAAIGALAAALFAMLAVWLRSWPKRFAVFLILVVATPIPFAAYAPLRARAQEMREALQRRDFEAFSAARTLPFLTAADMIRARPLVGVGPGAFAYNFFDYKLRLLQRRRNLFEHTTEMNYAEVHNDHLQVAAETGIPGYALLLAALLLVASPTWRHRHEPSDAPDEKSRSEFVRLLALPLAVSFFILALAQFPLELVAPTQTYLWAVSAIVAWRMS